MHRADPNIREMHHIYMSNLKLPIERMGITDIPFKVQECLGLHSGPRTFEELIWHGQTQVN